ncbi:MAG: hypothetical protein WC907_05260 [Acholeplasmataceae bacterium]
MDKNNVKIDDLLTLNHELKTVNNTLQAELLEANKKIEELSLLIAMNKSRTFGPKKESIDEEEINLFNFNEAERNATITIEEAKTELKTKTPRKAKSRNHDKIDFEAFVTEVITHDPSENLEGTFVDISEDIVYKAKVDVKIRVTKHIFKTIKNTETNEMLTPVRNFVFQTQ